MNRFYSKLFEIISGGITNSPSNRTPLAVELGQKFDVLVDMNQHHTATKGTSMATYALCGCIGGYFDNPDSNTFFHYDPFSTPIIDVLTRMEVSKKTKGVHFFVPGKWDVHPDGKYERRPKPEYIDRMLAKSISHIRSIGVKCEFHCYDELRMFGDGYLERCQGTAWIDKNGQLFAEGIQIHPTDKKNGIKPFENDGPA